MNSTLKSSPGPTPNGTRKFAPMFTLSTTARGDKHFGLIVRHVSDYAQHNGQKFHAAVAIIALFKFIIQIGVVIRRGKRVRRFPDLNAQSLGNN